MADNESVEEVKENLAKFEQLLKRIWKLAWRAHLSQEAKEADIQNWYIYEPRMKQMNSFLSNTAKWIHAAENPEAHKHYSSLHWLFCL